MSAGKEIKSTHQIDIYLRVPFSAKVALGTGYFLFDKTFTNCSDHEQLRQLLRPFDEIEKSTLRKNRILYFDQLLDPENFKETDQHKIVEGIIKHQGGASVIVTYGSRSISFSIGLFGHWQSTISVEAEPSKFPYEGFHDQGHVVSIMDGKMRQISFREATYDFATEVLGIKLPPLADVRQWIAQKRRENLKL